jgi:hypothetical protein
MICQNCEESFYDTVKICPICGTPTGVEITKNQMEPTTTKSNQTNPVTATASVVSFTSQSIALSRRYKDAYVVARITGTIGKIVKGIAIVVAGLGIVYALVIIGQNKGSLDLGPFFSLSLLIVIAGGLLFCIGVLIAAQGQVLLASLDSAVNSSPFLTNEQRARIMSL